MLNYPLEYALVVFPGNKFSGEIVPELLDLAQREIVRFVDIMNEGGLDDGLYELVLEVESEYMLADSIFVGGDHSLVDFALVNDSGEQVCYAYIAPSQAENWGQDRLGREESVSPGERREFQFASASYDVLLADCDGRTLLEEYNVDLAQERTLRFSGSG